LKKELIKGGCEDIKNMKNWLNYLLEKEGKLQKEFEISTF